jgi:hypothetical protein
MTPPTFCAKFSDGETTRMSTHCPNGLDPARGIVLSRAAYSSRKKRNPPEIVEARFETSDGALLKEYSADDITNIVSEKPVARNTGPKLRRRREHDHASSETTTADTRTDKGAAKSASRSRQGRHTGQSAG